MFYKKELCKNGEDNYWYYFYKCDDCGIIIEESYPMSEIDFKHFCLDCSFKKGLFSETEYSRLRGITFKVRVSINKNTGNIEMTTNKFSWEMKDKDYRATKSYKDWRRNVFERDEYTCNKCLKIGGNLEAHHIKSFKDHKDLRYDVDNGITLCKKCHKEIHKKKGIKNE